MSTFPVHSLESAPEQAKSLLQATQTNFGFIPNLIGIMATSPALTEAYLTIAELFSNSGLNPTEQQIVLLTVSRYNECQYCIAAHTAIASMKEVDSEIVHAIRNDQLIADDKLQALRLFTHLLMSKRGWLDESDIQDFLDAGYEKSQILDIQVGVAQKMLSNYTNHLAKTPLDEAFEGVAWQAPS